MKRLLIGLFALGLVLLARDSSAAAKSYTLTVTTNTPTGSAALFTAGGYPNITGGAFLDTLVIAGVSVSSQTVTLYDTCTSSMTATAKLPIVYTGTGTVVVTFPTARYKMTNPCIAINGTTSDTRATFIYE